MYPIVRNKTHLSNLPDIGEWQIPPRPDEISKRGIVLVPLFDGHPTKFDAVNYVSHHVAISACWARRSWMMHTDANDYGIEVKFYIEDCVRERAMPILERNFVEEQDIIWYDDGNKLEGVISSRDGYLTYGIKKCASYNDYRFRDYDWIFDIDSDVFAVSAEGGKVPFFQRFFENSPEHQLGACLVSSCPEDPPYLTPSDIGWCNQLKDSPEAWKNRFESVAGRDMLERYFSPDYWFMTCNGSIVSFPAKHFMRERRDGCEWLISTTRELLDLEATLSLWHSMGNPVFNITKHVNLVMFHSGFSPHEVGLFMQAFEKGAFLFHYAFPGIDYFWRKGIGI